MDGIIEVDELFVGGKPRKRNNGPKVKAFRKEKAIVLGIKQRGGKVGELQYRD